MSTDALVGHLNICFLHQATSSVSEKRFFRENAKSFVFRCIDRKESFVQSYTQTQDEPTTPPPPQTTQPTKPKLRRGSWPVGQPLWH
jgi:hypothetical protein